MSDKVLSGFPRTFSTSCSVIPIPTGPIDSFTITSGAGACVVVVGVVAIVAGAAGAETMNAAEAVV